MKKDDRFYLLHIRDALENILADTHEGKSNFLSDRKTQDAVIRNLEVIGEAVKKLSQKMKDANPEIAWKQIAGMRDKMIHEYFGVDRNLVWEVVEKNLPELRKKVASLLDAYEKSTPARAK